MYLFFCGAPSAGIGPFVQPLKSIIIQSYKQLITSYHDTHKKLIRLAYSSRCEISWLSSLELEPSEEMVLRTALRIVGISALESGMSSDSSVSSSVSKSWWELAARWCFARGCIGTSILCFVVVLVVEDISSRVRLVALLSALLIGSWLQLLAAALGCSSWLFFLHYSSTRL